MLARIPKFPRCQWLARCTNTAEWLVTTPVGQFWACSSCTRRPS